MEKIPTRLYLASADALKDTARFARLLKTVPDTRREKVLSYKNAEAARLSLAAGLLLEAALRDFGLEAGEMRTGEHGKPWLPALPGFHFSLSHSGAMAMCAVSSAPVGCDIERETENTQRIAGRFFHPAEKAWLLSLPEEERQAAFFRIWTGKESFMKATGLGFSLPLDAFAVLPGEEPALRQTVDPRPWRLWSYAAGEYACALCALEEPEDAPPRTVALEQL